MQIETQITSEQFDRTNGDSVLVGEGLEVQQVHLPAALRKKVVRLDAEALRLGERAVEREARTRDKHILAFGAEHFQTHLERAAAAARHHHVLRLQPPAVPLAPRRVQVRLLFTFSALAVRRTVRATIDHGLVVDLVRHLLLLARHVLEEAVVAHEARHRLARDVDADGGAVAVVLAVHDHAV